VERESRSTWWRSGGGPAGAAGSEVPRAGKGNAAVGAYGGIEGAVDRLVEARSHLARAEASDLAAVEAAASAGDEAAEARARVALGWQVAAARQCARDAEAAAEGDDAGWVREEAGRIRAALAGIEARADAIGADPDGPACEAAPEGGGGIGVAHLLGGGLATDPVELAAAETAAWALPAAERAAVLARVAAGRTVHAVREERAQQVREEEATSAPARLALSRRRVDLGETEVGLESDLERVWIRNDGALPVSIDEVRGPDEFPVAGECRAALEPGEAVEVAVAFRPATVGRREGELVIETDGGVPSAAFQVRGRGVEPTPATLAAARVDRATVAVRRGDGPAVPRTFAAMRELVHAARRLDEVGDGDGARRALEAVREGLREVASPARAAEVFARFGFGHQSAELSRAMAEQAVRDLLATLANRYPMQWDRRVLEFEAGRESIELLTGEAKDSRTFRAMDRGAKVTLGVLGGGMAALAGAPALLGEAALLGHAGLGAWRASWLWGIANPSTATALAAAGAGVAIDVADKGGPSAWAESATTWEGVLALVIEALQVYDAHINTRAASARPAAAEEPAADGVAAAAVQRPLGELEEHVPGEMWKGSRAQIERAVEAVRAAYPEVEVHADPAAGRWRLALGERSILLRQSQGRTLPPYAVRKDDIRATDDSEYNMFSVIFEVTGADGASVKLARGTVYLDRDGNPAEPPHFTIRPRVNYSDQFVVQIFDDVHVSPATPHPVGRGARTSTTRYVLTRFIDLYKERFGRTPDALGGTLGWDNLENFRREYARSRNQGNDSEAAAQEAIRRISYGKHREDIGYRRFVVSMGGSEIIDYGGEIGLQEVPISVEVTAHLDRGDSARSNP
jgi:hypothetical protein